MYPKDVGGNRNNNFMSHKRRSSKNKFAKGYLVSSNYQILSMLEESARNQENHTGLSESI